MFCDLFPAPMKSETFFHASYVRSENKTKKKSKKVIQSQNRELCDLENEPATASLLKFGPKSELFESHSLLSINLLIS